MRTLTMLLVACTAEPPPGGGEDPTPTPPEDTEPTPTPVPSTDPTTPPTDPPNTDGNVLVVLFDDVSVFDVGTYGLDAGAPPTPTLDRLAAEGMTFRHAWAMPACSPSRASLLTGRFPGRTGMGQPSYVVIPGPSLSPDETTLAELVHGAPILRETSMIGKWHLVGSDDPDPYGAPGRHGFDWFVGTIGNLRDPVGDGEDHSAETYVDWTKNDNGVPVHTTTYVTTDNADDAIDRMATMTEPWLLYLAFNAPHGPYHTPPAELVGDLGPDPTEWDQYQAMMRAADAELGRVLDAMDADLRARTTIVAMGDNGSPVEASPEPEPENWMFSVYERGVRVPLIVSGPEVTTPGSVSDAIVSVVDLFPTVAALTGVDLEGFPVPLDGVSLVPLLHDPSTTVHEQVFTQAFTPNGFEPDGVTYAIRDERYKLVFNHEWSYGPEGLGLYDLQGVELEGANLIDDPAYAQVREGLVAVGQAQLDAFEADPLH